MRTWNGFDQPGIRAMPFYPAGWTRWPLAGDRRRRWLGIGTEESVVVHFRYTYQEWGRAGS